MSISILSNLLQAACQSNDFYAITRPLDHAGPFDGTCLPIAHALYQLLPNSHIMVLVGWPFHRLLASPPLPCHAVLHVDHVYLDGNGVSSSNQLVQYWQQEERLMLDQVSPLIPEMLDAFGYNRQVTHDLISYFSYCFYTDSRTSILLAEQPFLPIAEIAFLQATRLAGSP